MKQRPSQLAVVATMLGLLLGLPLLGVWLAGQPLAQYLEFPPRTRYVPHAPFSWMAFVILGAGTLAVVAPFVWRALRTGGAPLDDTHAGTAREDPSSRAARSAGQRRRHSFPWWGWAGLVFGIAAWILAWTRFPRFTALQEFTFSPMWFAYIVVVNALTYRRTGHCMLRDRPRYLFALFLVSAFFWWFFEYLNRFVQNWHYVDVPGYSAWRYFVRATLPFATVLPAVLGTYELLADTTHFGRSLDDFLPIRVPRPRLLAWLCLVLSGVGLALIGVWPDVLFPLLWLSPCSSSLPCRPSGETTRCSRRWPGAGGDACSCSASRPWSAASSGRCGTSSASRAGSTKSPS